MFVDRRHVSGPVFVVRPSRQVDPVFDTGHLDRERLNHIGARKRGVLEMATGNCTDTAKRQKAWLTKDGDSASAAWRPIQLHRTSTNKWLLALDSQITPSMSYGGVRHFQFQEGDERWASWRTYLGLGIVSDLGSDGVNAINYLLYQADICTCH